MLGIGVGLRGTNSVSMETTCNALLKELQQVWAEIGETEAEKERMIMEIEKECVQLYRKKVDEASRTKAQLHQSVAAREAEVAALIASLGEHSLYSKREKNIGSSSLKEQLATVTPLLETLRQKREERIKQFSDLRSQIEKIRAELTEFDLQSNGVITAATVIDDHDFSIRKLNEYQAELRALQKEKSDRLQKVLEYVNEVHSLCATLGLDFKRTVNEVHPSLHDNYGPDQSTNISNSTLDGLSRAVSNLKEEKRRRIGKLRETVESLSQLWKLMDTSQEERGRFAKLSLIIQSPEETVTYTGSLSLETIDQVEAEVERLTKLKATRLKELVMKRRVELEEVCRGAHIEPDPSTVPEKTNALIDSGLVDASELLANIETQIVRVREESISRKDIMDQINKWLSACDEETWLEEYNMDDKRYSAGRGSHLNLKRAEKARMLVTKIPGMVDNLISRTFAWEDEKNTPFMYDGVRLVCILEEYKLTRQQKEEDKRRLRDQKKLQNLLQTEKELRYGSKPVPKKTNSFNRRQTNGSHANGNGFMTPSPRRQSVGSATPELLTPRSYSGRYSNHGFFNREMRRLSTAPLNFVAILKEDSVSTFTSVSGSEPESPLQR